MTSEISNAWYWSLILQVYSQEGILVPKDVEVTQFHHMFIPKSAIVDPLIVHPVGRIPDAMFNLVSPTNTLLVNYQASMDTTFFGSIPMKVTFKEGTSIESQVTKKKSKSKPKTVEKEVSVKNVLDKCRKRGSKKDTK